MTTSSDREISLAQAARTLHGTKTPTNEQIYHVIRLMKSGVLPGRNRTDASAKWTTTEAALARFMAANRVGQETRRRARVTVQDGRSAGSTPERGKPAALEDLYRSIWRDYFLSLMLRRRMAHRSAAFHRAVVAGQVLLLLAVVGIIAGTGQQLIRQTTIPAEHRAIERWIERNTDDYAVKHRYPAVPNADGEGVIVGVEYRYRKQSRRWIHTKRMFLVVGDDVTELSSDE